MANIYFITKKDSETGKKFEEIDQKAKVCHKSQVDFAAKYGFESWRPSRHHAWGRISSCLSFSVKPDPKIWGKGAKDGEYFPKRNSKLGMAIIEEINKMPIVTDNELNSIVGYKSKWYGTIGFNPKNNEYFGFVVDSEWQVNIPSDCEEVTYSRFSILFEKTTKDG